MDIVFVVMKNADFTEGRGPMLLHKIFKTGPAAVSYIQKQSGIFGSKQHIDYGKHGYYAYGNGYYVEETVVFDTAEDAEQSNIDKEVEQAMRKLTDREKNLLGLK